MAKFSWLSHQGYKILIDNLNDGVFVVDEGLLAYANPRLAEILGYEVDALIGVPFIELIASEEQSFIWERHRARLAGENVPNQYEIHVSTAQNSLIFCSLNVTLTETPDGQSVTIGTIRDLTRQKAELAELESSKMELKSIFDQLPDVFYRTNMQGIITMISPSCFDVLGYKQHEMLGHPMVDFYNTPDERQKIVQAITEGGGKATKVEAGLRHKHGNIVWISTNAFIRFDANRQPISVDGVARDITERKKMEDQLTALTRTDSLTEVYSRNYFLDKSQEIIELMHRYQRPASMMMMDLDHFKKINDSYGHHTGDLVLIAFTLACQQEIRESDILGRLGGEEFGLMLPETSLHSAKALAERILQATAAIAIPYDDTFINITVSIGIVELKAGNKTLHSLMRSADIAMYQAKERGRNQLAVAHEST